MGVALVVLAVVVAMGTLLFLKFMSTPFSLPFTKEGREEMSAFIPSASQSCLMGAWLLGYFVPMVVVPAVLGGLLYAFGATALMIIAALLVLIVYFVIVKECMFPDADKDTTEEEYRSRFRHNLPLFFTNIISGFLMFVTLGFLVYHFDVKPSIVQPGLYVFFVCAGLFVIYPLLFCDSYRKEHNKYDWGFWRLLGVVLRNMFWCLVLMLVVLYLCLCMAPSLWAYGYCTANLSFGCAWLGQVFGLTAGFIVAGVSVASSPLWLPFYWFGIGTGIFVLFIWIFILAMVIKCDKNLIH